MPATDPKKFHKKLIECYTALGGRKSGGICALYSETAIDAWLLEEKEFLIFEQRNTAIENSDANFPKLLAAVKAKQSSSDAKLNADEKLAADVIAFIEQGKPYFEPELYRNQFGKQLNQINSLEISVHAQPDALKKAGGRAQLLEVMGVYSSDELLEFAKQLNEFAIKAKVNFAFSLSCDTHRVSLAYNATHKEWRLLNASNPHLPPISAVGDEKRLVNAIRAAFENEFGDVDFNAKLFCRADHQDQLQPLVTALKTNNKFCELHKVTPERVNRVTTRGVTLAWLMAKHGNAEGLQQIIDLKNPDGTPLADLKKKHIKSGFPAIHMAMQNNHVAATKVLMDARYADGKRRVDVNYEDANGFRLVHQLAALGRVDLLKQLAEEGCDIQLRCYGQSPLDIAKDKKQQAVIDFFKAWDIRNSLIAEVDHLVDKAILVDKIIQDFHDNHQRFLNQDFLHIERQGLRLLQKPASTMSHGLFAKKLFPPKPVIVEQGCQQSCVVQ